MTAIPDPKLCVYADCLNLFTKTLGVADQNYPDGSVVAQSSPYTAAELGNRLRQADYQLRVLICRTQDNPYRELYYRGAPRTDFFYGGTRIPAGIGNYSNPIVKDEDELERAGDLAPNKYHIQKVLKQPAVYGSPKYLYYVDAGIAWLANDKSKISFDIPQLLFTAATLYSPFEYQWGVIALAMMSAAPVGTNIDHRQYWVGVMAGYQQSIEGRAMSLPEPDQLKRTGA